MYILLLGFKWYWNPLSAHEIIRRIHDIVIYSVKVNT